MRWESEAAGDAAVKEGISPHQHICRSVALLPGEKPLLGSFPRSAESLFLTPRLKSVFSKPCEDLFHSSIARAGWQLAQGQTQSGVRREHRQLVGLLVGQKEGEILLATEHFWWL